MLAIYKRELKSLFTSLISYLIIALYIIIFAIYFREYNLKNGVTSIAYPALYNCWFAFIAFAFLTMRSFPEEKKEKIDQLLYTSPVSIVKIVVGKYLAMCSVFAVIVLIMATCPLVIKNIGLARLTVDYTSLFAYFLLGCSLIAICMFISSLTESMIISVVVSIIVIFILEFSGNFINALSDKPYISLIAFVIIAALIGLVFGILTKNLTYGLTVGIVISIFVIFVYVFKQNLFNGAIQKVFDVLPPSNHLVNFIYYFEFDLNAIVYYASLIFLFNFFTVQTIQKRRYS